MIAGLIKSVFGSSNDRYVSGIRKIVGRINALESSIAAMRDEELSAQTQVFRKRLADGASLDSLLPEAFATVREVAKRTLGQRHYDVQMIGGIVMHRGEIAEMATGEGKTLVATLPAYLNAIEGKGVHVVTVNDYLARRDADWMGAIYRYLGLTTDVVIPDLPEAARRKAYAADIVYATNNELGFDYLRDNMKYSRETMVQRVFNFGIIDEVDSILIDEARTPLVISGPVDDKSELYVQVNGIVQFLNEEDYEKDEKLRTVVLTEEGNEHVELLLEKDGLLHGANLYDIENMQVVHHVNQAIKANVLFRCDTDYIVKDGKVVIIDEFTGRMMSGRRWSDGLHQAVEAKEGVDIEPENQTLASITFQNYFRMYPKLAGMTGTASTEAAEFFDIYKMNVVSIPTNKPIRRKDEEDEFYKNINDKFAAIAKVIRSTSEDGQPVLVGTVSIEKSELLSSFLEKEGVAHEILNARFHEREAHIVAQAGRASAVTIATNMAGRGTDIKLGGNAEFRIEAELSDIELGAQRESAAARILDEVAAECEQVKAAGGLFVLATERHESRRVDNQLRGRSGRQGDPGRSKFYLCLDDDLLRIFGSDTMFSRMMNSNMEDGEAIGSRWLSKAIETAQQKVEARNYDTRKQVVEYDDVMNDQRKVIYEQRGEIMDADKVDDVLSAMRSETIAALVDEACPPRSYPEQWDMSLLKDRVSTILNMLPPFDEWVNEDVVEADIFTQRLVELADDSVKTKETQVDSATWHNIEKSILLRTLDHHWKEHLSTLDALRQVVFLRAYAQKQPLNEYKQEAFALFERMLATIREDVTRTMATLDLRMEDAKTDPLPELPDFLTRHINPFTGEDQETSGTSHSSTLTEKKLSQGAQGAQEPQEALPIPPFVLGTAPKPATGNEDAQFANMTISRNKRCPCGSGRKYKHCHGAV